MKDYAFGILFIDEKGQNLGDINLLALKHRVTKCLCKDLSSGRYPNYVLFPFNTKLSLYENIEKLMSPLLQHDIAFRVKFFY